MLIGGYFSWPTVMSGETLGTRERFFFSFGSLHERKIKQSIWRLFGNPTYLCANIVSHSHVYVDKITRAVFSCVTCCLYCVEALIDRISKNGLVYTAIFGYPLWTGTACCCMLWIHISCVLRLVWTPVFLIYAITSTLYAKWRAHSSAVGLFFARMEARIDRISKNDLVQTAIFGYPLRTGILLTSWCAAFCLC